MIPFPRGRGGAFFAHFCTEDYTKVSFIITPLRWVVDLLYSWVGSYGVASFSLRSP